VVERVDRQLASTLTARFAAVQALLDKVRDGDGFVTYDSLTDAQVKEFAAAVDALGEPLSRLTATVLGAAANPSSS